MPKVVAGAKAKAAAEGGALPLDDVAPGAQPFAQVGSAGPTQLLSPPQQAFMHGGAMADDDDDARGAAESALQLGELRTLVEGLSDTVAGLKRENEQRAELEKQREAVGLRGGRAASSWLLGIDPLVPIVICHEHDHITFSRQLHLFVFATHLPTDRPRDSRAPRGGTHAGPRSTPRRPPAPAPLRTAR